MSVVERRRVARLSDGLRKEGWRARKKKERNESGQEKKERKREGIWQTEYRQKEGENRRRERERWRDATGPETDVCENNSRRETK